MVPKICSFDACEKPARGRGLCATHWARWRKHGDPSIVLIGSKPRHIGCKVDGCEKKHHTKGFCGMHAKRIATHGDPLIAGDHYPGRPRMEQPSYTGMHKRLFYDKGRAAAHSCVDCGSRAQEWSYDGGCPNELFETLEKMPIAYSTDQARYSPRCKKCHRGRDESLNRARGANGQWVA